MRHTELELSTRRQKGRVVLSAGLAGITAVVGFVNWLMLDNFLKAALLHSTVSPWSWTLLEDAFLLLIGIAWLCIVFYSHHYYSRGARKGRIWKHFARLTGIQVLIIFVAQVLLILLNGTISSIAMDAIAVVEGMVGSVLVYAGRLRKAPANDPGVQSRV